MNIRERTVRGFIGLGTARLLQQAVMWVLSIVIARQLDPTDYGLMALGVFFTNFLAFVSEFGLSSSLIQRKELDDRDVHAAFWVMLAANAGIYLVLWLLSYPIAQYYDTPRLAAVIQVLGLTFIVGSLRLIPLCLLTRDLQFERLGWAELGGGIASGITMWWLAVAGYGVWALVVGSLVASVATTVFMLWFRPWAPRPVFEFGRVRGMLRYGLSMNGSKILTYLSGNADNLIVGKVLGGAALGVYNMAFILGTMPTQKVTPIVYRISFPVLARLQEDRVQSSRYFLQSTRYLALAAMPAMLGLMLAADDVVGLALGAKWAAVVTPLRILCTVGVLKALAVMLNVVLSARDRAGTLLAYGVLEAVVLSAAFLTGARFGIVGVAAAWLVAYPALFGYQLHQVLRELQIPLRVYAGNLRWVALAAASMIAAVLGVRLAMAGSGAGRLACSILAGAATYAAVILLDRSLREGVARVVRGRFPKLHACLATARGAAV